MSEKGRPSRRGVSRNFGFIDIEGNRQYRSPLPQGRE